VNVNVTRPLCLGLAFSLLLAACSSSGPDGPVTPSLSPDVFADPPPEFRPWVRWWWPGNDVTDEELSREVAALHAVGFGGLEIQAFDAALDPDATAEELARRRSYDTESFYDHLRTALEAARAHGLTADLTLGSGWPLGGARIAAEDSLQTLLFNEWSVTGPTEVTLDALAPKKTAFYEIAEIAEESFGERMARFEPERFDVVAVLAAKRTGGKRTSSIIDLTDTLNLDRDSVQDITDRVGSDGTLTWSAPEGRWQIVALFRGPDGQYPQLVAEPDAASGYAVDHLAAERVTAQLEHLLGARTGLASLFGKPLRAFFTDSLEFKTERHWADGFVEEFEQRRGYDPTPWLPAVFLPGADNYIFEAGRLDRAPEFAFGDNDDRVRHDYGLTVSELFVERFLGTTESWAGARGLGTRVQAYGMDLDNLCAAGAVSFPEAEQLYAGGSDLFLRIVSSGGHLYGRSPVSAEAMVWPLRDHMTTPTKVKAGADKAFGAGINHLILHGYPYAAAGDFGEIGWTPFSSRYGGTNTFASSFGERWEYAADLPALNRYLSRCQYLLRQGRPEADLLVYYPWLGFPTSLALEPGFVEPLLGGYLDGVEPELREIPFGDVLALLGAPATDRRAAWLMRIRPVLEALERAGYTWDWVNDHSLAEATARGRRIDVRGVEYSGLLLFEVPWIAPDASDTVALLARAGVAVAVLGTQPAQQPGLYDRESGDGRVADAMAEVAGGRRFAGAKGADDVVAALAAVDAQPAVALGGDGAARVIHRRLDSGGRLSFLRNPLRETVAVTVAPAEPCGDAHWLDPWSGEMLAAGEPVGGAFPLSLHSFESIALVCSDGPRDAAKLGPPPGERRLSSPATATATQLGPWRLVVTGDDVIGFEAEGSTDGRFDAPVGAGADYFDFDSLRRCSSPGTYSTSFEWDGGYARAEIDLGEVLGTAEVEINGEHAGRLIVPPFRVDATGQLQAGTNTIAVTLTPPLRNRLVGYAADGDERYAQFTGKEDTAIHIGLIGPVRLLRAAQ